MESELLLSVAKQMVCENILTQKGLDMLYSIQIDPYHECLYYSIAIRLTETYGDFVDQHKMERTSYQRLRKSAIDCYIRFYMLKKQLSIDEVKACHEATKDAFTLSNFRKQ